MPGTEGTALLDRFVPDMPPRFFQKIVSGKHGASFPVFLAPMVDQSERAFRLLCRRYGVDLCYTPMINSKMFVQSKKYRLQNFDFQECEQDRPLIVQFSGHDSTVLLAAAKVVEPFCEAVDLNFGCPQKIAKKGNYGAYLLEDADRICKLVDVLSSKLKVPVTAKIRLPLDRPEAPEVARRLENAGCSLLAVHGRDRTENKQLTRRADWEAIKMVKANVNIPVIANGGMSNYDEVQRCYSETGCDGVMLSEGMLENPALCQYDYSLRQQVKLSHEYLDLVEEFPPANFKQAKSHLFKFLHCHLSVYSGFRMELSKAKGVVGHRRVVEAVENMLEEDVGLYSDRTDSIDEKWSNAKLYYFRYRGLSVAECLQGGDNGSSKSFFESLL